MTPAADVTVNGCRVRLAAHHAHPAKPLPPPLVLKKDFDLTQSGSKSLRIALDFSKFAPLIILRGEPSVKPELKLSFSQLQGLFSPQVGDAITQAFESKSPLRPIIMNDLLVSVPLSDSFLCVKLEKQPCGSDLTLGKSSFLMLQRSKTLILDHMNLCLFFSKQTSQSWPELLKISVSFLNSKGIHSKQHLQALSYNDLDSLLSTSLKSVSTSFPSEILDELICYHMPFIQSQILETLPEEDNSDIALTF